MTGNTVPNKIRCKNCKHYKPTDDKNFGYCMRMPIKDSFYITTRNMQNPYCFEKKDYL